MTTVSFKLPLVEFTFDKESFLRPGGILNHNLPKIVVLFLACLSFWCYFFFFESGLGLAYNDARSHLDIGRRVVEGLKPGLAQLGSVWLPLPHVLMVPTIWNDFMWHSGLSGALVSMLSFVATGVLIYRFLHRLGVSQIGKILGVLIFSLNLNVLYLQSTAMTELLLLFTMTAASYYIVTYLQEEKIIDFIKCAFFTMLATLVRYDGWFLLTLLLPIIVLAFRKDGIKKAEGILVFFLTLAGVGVAGWFIWNKLIFNDALYFIFGPYSANAQQLQLEKAGVLETKHNLFLSAKIYLYALVYNSNLAVALVGLAGAIYLWLSRSVNGKVRLGSLALISPLLFNVLALYLGHSVLFVQGISGDTWFNVRYGVMLMPSIAIFAGYLLDKLKAYRWAIVCLLAISVFFSFSSRDAVTIDDALVGSSQKNVSEVSSYLKRFARSEKGFVLISAASHDAIIFSSGLPMSRFIHEGTGAYWDEATTSPEKWARWIVMRTYDDNDLTYKAIKNVPGFAKYNLVEKYPFADVYELKPEYRPFLITKPILKQRK